MEAEPETKVVDHESKTKRGSDRVVDLLAVDRSIGRYELVHRLGHGGMATVYLARASGRGGFEKLVAVKVIHPHLANEPEFVEMFLDEARIAAQLQHPNVVQILDVDDHDGAYCMVMEYVEGDTLASLLRQQRKDEELLTLPVILQLAADACAGLAAAHELADRDGNPYQLVHRDVSPHNLLVGMDGHVKVVDFGIMKAAGKRSTTLTGQLRGKLSYMSPEQAKGRPLDHRTDIFALGAVLWELCTNERLFEAEAESATLELVTKCEVPKLVDHRDDLPADLGQIIERALAKDPEDRYETAQGMLRDLRALLRKLDSDDDPRAEVAALMSKRFTSRIEYIRAAVRNRDASTAPASASMLTAEPAANTDATAILSTPNGISPAGVAAASDSGEERVQTGTATVTALATAPARHWSLWLVLPLVGAAIGTAVVGWGARDRDEPEAPAAVAQPAEPAPPPTQPVESKVPVEPAPAAEENIRWFINSSPMGASVTIAGKTLDNVTPTEVTLPYGDEKLEVEFSLEGYKKHVLYFAPVHTDNIDARLQPEPKEEVAPLAKPMPKFRMRTKPKAKPEATDTPPEPTAADSGNEPEVRRPPFEALLDGTPSE